MSATLTGSAADAYLSAWMESARSCRPLHAARLRRDALAACTSPKALARLRLASSRRGVHVERLCHHSWPRHARHHRQNARQTRPAAARAASRPRGGS